MGIITNISLALLTDNPTRIAYLEINPLQENEVHSQKGGAVLWVKQSTSTHPVNEHKDTVIKAIPRRAGTGSVFRSPELFWKLHYSTGGV